MSNSSPARKSLLISSPALLFVLLLDAAPAAEREAGGIVPSAVGSYRNSWAVVIGINRYIKAPRLNYAVNDAKTMVATLRRGD